MRSLYERAAARCVGGDRRRKHAEVAANTYNANAHTPHYNILYYNAVEILRPTVFDPDPRKVNFSFAQCPRVAPYLYKNRAGRTPPPMFVHLRFE